MSGIPSFERFDYVLRTNKHIERKLVFDVLQAADRKFGLNQHWYLGFGSMWFGDFRLAHKILAVRDMLSLEHKEHAERADFNRPFSCISVSGGDSAEVLLDLPKEKWHSPLISWLDYDKELNAQVVSDLTTILDRGAPNSVLVVTVNGNRGTYRVRRPGGQLSREETSVGVVESFIGRDSTPPRFAPTTNTAGFAQDVREADFSEFLAEALLNFLQHHVTSGAREKDGVRLKFVPLYSICHKDGAEMVTVGGALCLDSEVDQWKDCVKNHAILTDGNGRLSHCRLDLIPVTVKEKITLDGCLPLPVEDADFLANARNAGVRLADDELRKYKRFYRHFPVFAETSL